MIILIVDDNPTNLRVLRAQLESVGHTVVDAADGVEALAALESATFDAVVSDVLMPSMDGFRLCLEIRRSARLKAIPFIIYTSTLNSPADRKLAAEVGADRYVSKPAGLLAMDQILVEVSQMRRNEPTVSPPAAEELGVIKQYNASLVAKLEERNGELEKAIADLHAGEARYHGTLEHMLEGCQIIGYDWHYLYLNETAARHGRRPREELLGRTPMECFPGFDQLPIFATMRRCMIERTGARVENPFTAADGTQSWFELSIQPVPEGIFILSLDVSERRRVAEKNEEQLAELLRWQELMIGREERLQMLRVEVNELLAELQRPPRYPLPPA